MKKIALMLMSLLILTVFMGCANEVAAEPTDATEESTEQAEVVTEEETQRLSITHKLGTVDIPKAPKKVVSIDLATIDTLKALELSDSIVGISSSRASYLEDVLGDLPVVGSMFEPDFEGIASLEPDLIFISARTSKAYEDLSEIAPVVYLNYPGIDNPNIIDTVKNNVALIASIYGVEEKASDLNNALDAQVLETTDAIGQLENKDALMLLISGKKINAYGPEEKSRYGYVFNLFGYQSDVSQEQLDNNASTHGESISYEFISEINPDYMFVIDRGAVTGEGDSSASDTLNNAFIEQTEAYKNNHITYVSSEEWYMTVGGYQSLTKIIEELNPTQ